MINKIKRQASRLNRLIRTKKFKWFRGLTLTLAFTATASVSFLAGFFLNRDDNMIYKSNISNSVNAQSPSDFTDTSEPCVTTAPPAETTTEATTTRISVNGVLINSKLIENLDLEDEEYTYTNSADFKKRSNVKGMGVPLTKKSFTVTYNGTVTAGIDVSMISVSADNDARKISVILPEAEITGHTIDEDSVKLTDVNDNWINPINDDDYAYIIDGQKYQMEQNAINGGLLDDVYESTESAIKDYLMNDNTISEYYSINFVISKN